MRYLELVTLTSAQPCDPLGALPQRAQRSERPLVLAEPRVNAWRVRPAGVAAHKRNLGMLRRPLFRKKHLWS